jgi:hypothetical protein
MKFIIRLAKRRGYRHRAIAKPLRSCCLGALWQSPNGYEFRSPGRRLATAARRRSRQESIVPSVRRVRHRAPCRCRRRRAGPCSRAASTPPQGIWKPSADTAASGDQVARRLVQSQSREHNIRDPRAAGPLKGECVLQDSRELLVQVPAKQPARAVQSGLHGLGS